MKVKLTPYDMEVIYRALRDWRNNERVVLTSNEDALTHIDSLAQKFMSCTKVEMEIEGTSTS